jgi:hypothetical protein
MTNSRRLHIMQRAYQTESGAKSFCLIQADKRPVFAKSSEENYAEAHHQYHFFFLISLLQSSSRPPIACQVCQHRASTLTVIGDLFRRDGPLCSSTARPISPWPFDPPASSRSARNSNCKPSSNSSPWTVICASSCPSSASHLRHNHHRYYHPFSPSLSLPPLAALVAMSRNYSDLWKRRVVSAPLALCCG